MPENENVHFLEWVRYVQGVAESIGLHLSARKARSLAPSVMLRCADDGARPPHSDPVGEEAVRNVLLGYMAVAA